MIIYIYIYILDSGHGKETVFQCSSKRHYHNEMIKAHTCDVILCILFGKMIHSGYDALVTLECIIT